MKTPQNILQKLNKRKEEYAFRELMTQDNKIDFFSNDYLGVSKIPFESIKSHGSTGSRLISGNSKYTEKIEHYLADFFGFESGLFFNSGYDANLGIFSCIPQKGDTIFYDELIHASIRDGIRLSLAKSFSFRHNDVGHLKEKLKYASGNVYIAVESIYSMDGDMAPLIELAGLCADGGYFLIVDEAHSGGISGEGGCGLVSELKLNNQIFCKLITFGKAYGSHGAIVLCNENIKSYLLNFARSLIYSTALPASAIERIENVVNQVAMMNNERLKLHENIKFFNHQLAKYQVNLIPSLTPIQSIIFSGNQLAIEKANQIKNDGFAVKAILSPTVPKGQERIRICLHSFNSTAEIESLFNSLK